jgi:hypothetical protein
MSEVWEILVLFLKVTRHAADTSFLAIFRAFPL